MATDKLDEKDAGGLGEAAKRAGEGLGKVEGLDKKDQQTGMISGVVLAAVDANVPVREESRKQVVRLENGKYMVNIRLLLPFFNREWLLDHRIDPDITGPNHADLAALAKLYHPKDFWHALSVPKMPGLLRQLIIGSNPEFNALRDDDIGSVVEADGYEAWVQKMIARHGEWLDLKVALSGVSPYGVNL